MRRSPVCKEKSSINSPISFANYSPPPDSLPHRVVFLGEALPWIFKLLREKAYLCYMKQTISLKNLEDSLFISFFISIVNFRQRHYKVGTRSYDCNAKGFRTNNSIFQRLYSDN